MMAATMSDQALVVVVFKDRESLDSGNALSIGWPPSQDFLSTLDVKRVGFFQRLEGKEQDYHDNPLN